MRHKFSHITAAIANDRELAQVAAIELLMLMGHNYNAIYEDTKLTPDVFYDSMFETIEQQGWWSCKPPELFGSTDQEAAVIAGVVQQTLSLFAHRGDDRNYSLLTKWLHFCFPTTFAIYDSRAARSIGIVMGMISVPPNVNQEQFQTERISVTYGTGYIGLLNFYRLFWETVRGSRLDKDLSKVADDLQQMLQGEPSGQDAKVSALDVLDKLLWKANGSTKHLGLDQS